MKKRKFAGGGGVGSFLKQKVNRNKTDHGVGLGVPMANLKKFRGFAGGGDVDRESARLNRKPSERELAADTATEKVLRKYRGAKADDQTTIIYTADDGKTVEGQESLPRKRGKLNEFGYATGGSVKTFAKGGNVSVPKKKLLNALMLAKQAGAQQAARPAPPAPGAGAPPPMGMKKGGFVPFGKKKDAGGDDKKEKWTPPWAKKAKGGTVKMAGGGMVGGRGDGCAVKGRTKGTMR